MSSTLQHGPLVLSWGVLLVFLAAGVGLVLARRAQRRFGVDVETPTWRIVWVAVVVARVAFVWAYRSAYADSPLSILNLRDGGWDAQAGLMAAWAYALYLTRQPSPLRKPLWQAVAVGSVVWLMGTAVLMGTGRDATPLPSLNLARLEGGSAALDAFKGKPTVVNVWATWCPPCQHEMPVLQQAQQAHPDVHFVFVNQAEALADVQGFLASRGLVLRNVLLDTRGEVAARLDVRAYPTTLFFDAQGRLVERRVGELSAATLAQKLDAVKQVAKQGARP